MKSAIENIVIMERIRKEITRIPELAEDIMINGLLNPVTVMTIDGDKLRLLAGLRRVRAAQALGWKEIEVNVVSPADAEAALRIEISENEQREGFTFVEKMDYARLIEEIEKAKANERKAEGQSLGGATAGNGRTKDSCLWDESPTSNCETSKQRVRDAVGAKINMSGRQYDRAKYIAENAPSEVIEQLDKGEKSITGAFKELRANEKAEKMSAPKKQAEPTMIRSDNVSEEEQMKYLSEKDREAIRKLREYNALPPEGKIVELQKQIKELRARAATAESELATLKDRYGIDVDHKDSIIESLKRQNTELSDALEAANARIAELEAA